MVSLNESVFDCSDLSETSAAFEQDSFVLEGKISALEENIAKSINEVAKIFEMKYQDFVPHLLSVGDCQEKIQSALKAGNAKIKKVQGTLVSMESNVNKAMENALNKKLGVIRGLIDRLKVLSEVEACFSALWVGVQGGDSAKDVLADATVILKLESLIRNLESDMDMGAISERILPLIFAETAARRCDILLLLDDFYKTFIQFRNFDNLNEGAALEMVVKCSSKTASDNLTAMHKLGELDQRLEQFVDSVWKMCCLKIIHSENPKDLIAFRMKDYDGFITFSIRKDIPETTRPSPELVFRGIQNFFTLFYDTFKQVIVDDVPFTTRFGDLIVPKLLEALTKDCLIPSIPHDHKDEAVYKSLFELCSKLCQFFVEKQFTSSETLHFDYFLNNYDKLFIDRRCRHFISVARDLVTKPYIELVSVGSCDNEEEENIGEIEEMINEKMKLNDADLLSTPQADKFSTKLFQFQKCSISKSTFDFVQVLYDCILSAMDAKSDLEMCRLFTTARNMLDIFVSMAPMHHQQALTTVPQIAAVFFNNCHYLCNRLVTIQTDMQKKTKLPPDALNEFNFVNYFAELRTISANILEQHVIQIRRQISTAIGSGDIFVSLREEAALKKCERALNACTLHISQVAKVWREVMSEFVLAKSLGMLISHLMTVVTDIVLAKEDITASDATITGELLTRLQQQLKKILIIENVEVIHRVCEESYYRMNEVIFCLNASLMDIGHRWCDGKGPLSEWLKAYEVKKLIRALFQNTDRRAQLLAHIN